MGCCATKLDGSDGAIWRSGLEEPRNTSPHDVLASKLSPGKGNMRMSERSMLAVRDMFDEYRSKTRSCEKIANDGTKMSKTGLRLILQDAVDDALFEFIWRLFDPNDNGMVSCEEFVMAMALFTTELETFEDQVSQVISHKS